MSDALLEYLKPSKPFGAFIAFRVSDRRKARRIARKNRSRFRTIVDGRRAYVFDSLPPVFVPFVVRIVRA